MKKLLPMVVFLLFLAGCQQKDSNSNHIIITQDAIAIGNSKDYSDCQNDLVYHDYGTGIRLTSNSSLSITQLNLELEDETAVICAINLETNEVTKISVYQPNQSISFTPIFEGVYQLIAIISTGEQRDLTPNAIVATDITTVHNKNGFILLH